MEWQKFVKEVNFDSNKSERNAKPDDWTSKENMFRTAKDKTIHEFAAEKYLEGKTTSCN